MTSILRTVDDIRTQLTRKEDEILQVQRRIDDCEKEMKADKVPWEIRIQHLGLLQEEKNHLRQQQTALLRERMFLSILLRCSCLI